MLDNQLSFEQFLYKYERLIHHIARRYFPQAEDAMDACQEAVIRIYKGLPKAVMPEGGSLKGWVCTVSANTCVDILRKRRLVAEALPEGDFTYITEPSAEETAIARERARMIMEAISQLPEEHRRLIIFRDMCNLSYQEMAEAVGINEGTVKSRLSRARAALRKILVN